MTTVPRTPRQGSLLRRARAVVVALVALVALAPAASTARARAGASESPAAKRERGLMAVAAVGLDGCTGRQCQNTYPLLYTRLHAAFRALPYLAAGVHLTFNFLAPDFPMGGGRVEFWELFVGPEVRGLLPLRRFDVWAGFALGYHRSYRLVDSDGHRIESATNAFGLAWGLGLDYYLVASKHGSLAVGGDLWFYKPFPTRLCSTIGANPTVCVDSGIAEQFGVTYAAGFTFTWFLSL